MDVPGAAGLPGPAPHLVLRRLEPGGGPGAPGPDPHDEVEVLETPDGVTVTGRTCLPLEALPALVAAREPGRPRWTWDCATRWYPSLLRRRRPGRAVLGPAPDPRPAARLAARGAGAGRGLGAVGPAAGRRQHRLGPVRRARPARPRRPRRAAPAEGGAGGRRPPRSRPAGRGRVLRRAGRRRDDRRRAALARRGPRRGAHRPARPAPARRPPARRARAAARRRSATPSAPPGSTPTPPAPCSRPSTGPGWPSRTPAPWTLQQLDHPVGRAAARLQEARPAARRQRLAVAGHLGRRRPVPDRLPRRRGGHRALVLARRRRAHGPRAAAAGGGGRRRLAPGRRPTPRSSSPASWPGWPGDRAMAAAGRGTDLYAGMVASGAVATRAEAKLGIIGAMYGGTRGESGRMVARLAQRYPAAFALVEEAARAGERGEVVRTLLGRGSPAAARRLDGAGRRGAPLRPGRGAAAPVVGPLHPQLRRPGHGRGVGARLARAAAQPAAAHRRRAGPRTSGRGW